jgi:hypothetical protein
VQADPRRETRAALHRDGSAAQAVGGVLATVLTVLLACLLASLLHSLLSR